MRYRHKRTGTLIEIASVLTSPEWEEIREKPAAPKPKKKEKQDEHEQLRADR